MLFTHFSYSYFDGGSRLIAQTISCKWLKVKEWTTKQRTRKISFYGVKNYVFTFCLSPPVQKTNRGLLENERWQIAIIVCLIVENNRGSRDHIAHGRQNHPRYPAILKLALLFCPKAWSPCEFGFNYNYLQISSLAI